jgi:hypothetical protein
MSQLAPLSLPSELLAKLPSVADLAWHLRLLAGLSSLVGETHLVGTRDGRLRVYSRSSMLAPFEEVAAVSSVRIARSTLRTELVVESASGTHTLPLGYREVDELATFLGGEEGAFVVAEAAPAVAAEPAETAPASPATASATTSSYLSSPWTSASVPTTPFVPSPGVAKVPTFVAAPPDPHAPTATDQWALRRVREDLVNTLSHRVMRARPRPDPTLPRFAALLEGPTPRATRRALLDARFELEQGRTERALALLEDAGSQGRWQVRVAQAELLEDAGKPKQALAVLASADAVGAPARFTFAVRERAARAANARRPLLLALRQRRQADPTGSDGWELDREIRELEAQGAAIRKANQAKEAINRAEKAAATMTRAERKRAERSTRPPQAAGPKKKRRRKVKQPADPRIPTLQAPGQRALQSASLQRELAGVRRSRAKNGPLTPSSEVKPDANSALWLLAAALFFLAFGYFLYWRSQGGGPVR